MNAVLRPADREGNHFVILANPAEVSPQSRLPFFCDRIAAIFHAEDEMDMVSGKRHVP